MPDSVGEQYAPLDAFTKLQELSDQCREIQDPQLFIDIQNAEFEPQLIYQHFDL